jgi:hypothetical protein
VIDRLLVTETVSLTPACKGAISGGKTSGGRYRFRCVSRVSETVTIRQEVSDYATHICWEVISSWRATPAPSTSTPIMLFPMYSPMGVLCTVVSIDSCCTTHSFPLLVVTSGAVTSFLFAPVLRTFLPGCCVVLASACLKTFFCKFDGPCDSIRRILSVLGRTYRWRRLAGTRRSYSRPVRCRSSRHPRKADAASAGGGHARIYRRGVGLRVEPPRRGRGPLDLSCYGSRNTGHFDFSILGFGLVGEMSNFDRCTYSILVK